MNDHPLMILLLAAVVNNFTLTLFLGICAFIGVSSKVRPRCAWARPTPSSSCSRRWRSGS